VDIFGNSIADIIIEDPADDSAVFTEGWVQPALDKVGFRCGSSLINGNSWGCRKIFAGLSAFAEHLKSSVGAICWIPLLSCSTLGHQLSFDLSQYAALSGLPVELFTLYPALKRVKWGNLTEAIPSQIIPDPIPLVWEEREALSTIASVSTRTQSNSMSWQS